ncbi:hypothetical protein K501DRAFT_243460 [Backusella circina FSU 941]|nr:hypothetical protein K501DRAFT_243460 [Backusella circina FSU 941]
MSASYYSGSGVNQTYVNPDNIALAEEQLNNVAELFNRITEACYNKCITEDKTKLSEADESCIDNCVAKYLQAENRVKSSTQELQTDKQQ